MQVEKPEIKKECPPETFWNREAQDCINCPRIWQTQKNGKCVDRCEYNEVWNNKKKLCLGCQFYQVPDKKMNICKYKCDNGRIFQG